MSRITLIGLLAIALLLAGASAVLAQDATQGAPGAAVTATPVCPTTGVSNIEQMKQMHDAMGQNVPEGMQQMHDAMGQALQDGDAAQIQQLHNTCMGQGNTQST